MDRARMAVVVAVNRSNRHSFTKKSELRIRLLAGAGVEGDVHAGAKVQHRYSARKFGGEVDTERQVHFIQEELFGELRAAALMASDYSMNRKPE